MSPYRDRATSWAARKPAGLTLVELLLAISIMAMMAVALGGLANAVQQNNKYSEGYGATTQHARVVLDRIGRSIMEATASEEHPGVAVSWKESGSWRFPDTLLVWHPTGTPANVDGPPLVGEVILYCPNPDKEHQLLEITLPGDTRTIPFDATLETPAGRSFVESLKTAKTANRVVLTHLLRVSSPDGSPGSQCGAVRFMRRLRPTAAEWTSLQGGTLAWKDLSWPQGLYGSKMGMRQVSVRIELQLVPEYLAGVPDLVGEQCVPFFSSAAAYYEMQSP